MNHFHPWAVHSQVDIRRTLSAEKRSQLRDWPRVGQCYPIDIYIYTYVYNVILLNGLLIFHPSSEFACLTVTFVIIACPQGRARDAICGDKRPGDRLLSGHSVYVSSDFAPSHSSISLNIPQYSYVSHCLLISPQMTSGRWVGAGFVALGVFGFFESETLAGSRWFTFMRSCQVTNPASQSGSPPRGDDAHGDSKRPFVSLGSPEFSGLA